jgi:hypothetical protein
MKERFTKFWIVKSIINFSFADSFFAYRIAVGEISIAVTKKPFLAR